MKTIQWKYYFKIQNLPWSKKSNRIVEQPSNRLFWVLFKQFLKNIRIFQLADIIYTSTCRHRKKTTLYSVYSVQREKVSFFFFLICADGILHQYFIFHFPILLTEKAQLAPCRTENRESLFRWAAGNIAEYDWSKTASRVNGLNPATLAHISFEACQKPSMKLDLLGISVPQQF